MNKFDQMDEDQGSGLDAILTNLPVMLWQRKWLVIVPLVICMIAGLAAAFLLPRTYRSTATLLVESQELPDEIAGGSSATNVIDQRIAKIRQQILSRPDLIELIQNNSLYTRERASSPLSEVIEDMRDAVTISPVNADIAQGSGKSSTIAFTLSYDYPEAIKAQTVAQEFVDRLMKLDASQTERQATNTAAFLQEQADQLQGQITQLENQITGIKAANGAVLASGMGGVVVSSGNQGQIAALRSENIKLQAMLATASSGATSDPEVVAARSRLQAAVTRYSDTHPDVLAARAQLAAAQAAARSGPAPNTSYIQQQIASNQALIGSLMAQQGADAARAGAASRAPMIMEEVSQLEAKADALRFNYNNVQTKLMNAQAQVKIETEQRGERLTIIDPPVVPDQPASPNRPLLIAGGIAVGGMIGLALAFLVELVFSPIRGATALTRLAGMPPLVVIPEMGREVESKWRTKAPFRWLLRRRMSKAY